MITFCALPVSWSMRDFRKLEVAVQARELVIAVYRITGTFPSTERYGLAAQMRKAAVSVASNIAEGTGRAGAREFLHFLYIALGSATELAIQVDLAIALDFVDAPESRCWWIEPTTYSAC